MTFRPGQEVMFRLVKQALTGYMRAHEIVPGFIPFRRCRMSTSPPTVPMRSAHVDGMLLMIGGMLTIPGIDAIAKFLADDIAAGQVAWSRFLFQTILLTPVVLIRPKTPGAFSRPFVHFARGFLIASATLMFFASLKVLPMADAISIFFVEPFILTLISAVFLGEKIGWRRIGAICFGFAGALIIIRPSYSVFGMASLLPIGAACAFAIYLALTRSLAQAGDPYSMQLTAGISGFLVMSAALAFGWFNDVEVLTPVVPDAFQWGLLALLGLIGTGAHLLVVNAFKRAPASLLAPFQYLEIISATLLGFLIFGDFPDTATWIGIGIIVGSGLYVLHRERISGSN
jgi:S-adenosylmethionine uptake transporter